MFFKKSIISVAILTLFIPMLNASMGKVRIKVKDSKGNPLSGVTITLQSQKVKQVVFTLKTKKSGIAIQVGLQNHLFLITVEKEGYRTLMKKVKLPLASMLEESFTLLTNEESLAKSGNPPENLAVTAYNTAVTHFKNKEYAEAVENFNKALQLDNTLTQIHFYMGVGLYELKQYKEAEVSFQKALSVEKEGNARLFRMLAAVCEKLGKQEESQKYNKLAQAKGGKTAIDAYNEGIHAFNAGKIDQATASLQESIKLNPNFAEPYFQLAMCYLNNSVNDKAIAAFKKYLELAPNGKDAATAKSIMESL